MFSWAALCDDTYNLQGATQTLFIGADPKNLAKTTQVLKADLSDMALIHDQMAYNILVGFEGSCAKASKPVRFLQREGQAASLASKVDVGHQVVMYDSNTILQGSRFAYWFAFYKPSDTLKMALGRTRNGAGDFRDLVFDGNRRGHFKLQFIRVSLENKPAAILPRARTAGSPAAGSGQDPAHFRPDGRKIAGDDRQIHRRRLLPALRKADKRP